MPRGRLPAVRILSVRTRRQLNAAVIIAALSIILIAGGSSAEKQSDIILDNLTASAEVESLIEDAFSRLFDFKISGLDPSTAESYATELGFASVEEARRARPKVPFPIYHVRLDQLRAYSEQDNPKSDTGELLRELLINTHSWIFPISTTKHEPPQVRSSVTVVAIGKDLRISQMESPELVQQLTTARMEAKYRHPDLGCSCIAIGIPALSRTFFGDMTTDIPMIKVLEDGPGTLKKGAFLQAKQVFQELSREAQDSRYDAPPRSRSKRQSIHY